MNKKLKWALRLVVLSVAIIIIGIANKRSMPDVEPIERLAEEHRQELMDERQEAVIVDKDATEGSMNVGDIKWVDTEEVENTVSTSQVVETEMNEDEVVLIEDEFGTTESSRFIGISSVNRKDIEVLKNKENKVTDIVTSNPDNVVLGDKVINMKSFYEKAPEEFLAEVFADMQYIPIYTTSKLSEYLIVSQHEFASVNYFKDTFQYSSEYTPTGEVRVVYDITGVFKDSNSWARIVVDTDYNHVPCAMALEISIASSDEHVFLEYTAEDLLVDVFDENTDTSKNMILTYAVNYGE